MKKLIMIFTLVVILGMGTMAFAGNGNGGPGGNGGQNYSDDRGQGNPDMPPLGRGGKALCDGGGSGSGFYQMGFGFMLGNLSEEEKAQLFEVRDAFQEETEGIREEIHAKWEALQSAIRADEVDLEVVEILLKELYDLKYEFAQMRLDHILEIKELVGNFGEVLTMAE